MSSDDHTVTLASDDGSDPLVVLATVVTVQRREEPEIFGGTRLGLYAHLDVTIAEGQRPHSFLLSRLVGEVDWVVDAQFTANGFPVHANGFGARYLRTRAIAPQLAELVDGQARDGGLVSAIGPDVPLVLAGN